MRDFPNDVLKEMAADPAQPGKGPWSITLHPYLYRKFLEYCPLRALRKNAYRAKACIGSRVVIQLKLPGSPLKHSKTGTFLYRDLGNIRIQLDCLPVIFPHYVVKILRNIFG